LRLAIARRISSATAFPNNVNQRVQPSIRTSLRFYKPLESLFVPGESFLVPNEFFLVFDLEINQMVYLVIVVTMLFTKLFPRTIARSGKEHCYSF